jgi:hypothetical protein
MPITARTSALGAIAAAALGLGGCQVNVDNQSKANLENAADSVGSTVGNVADAAGNVAGAAAAKVENAASSVGDKVKNTDVSLNIEGGDDHASNKSKHK